MISINTKPIDLSTEEKNIIIEALKNINIKILIYELEHIGYKYHEDSDLTSKICEIIKKLKD